MTTQTTSYSNSLYNTVIVYLDMGRSINLMGTGAKCLGTKLDMKPKTFQLFNKQCAQQ